MSLNYLKKIIKIKIEKKNISSVSVTVLDTRSRREKKKIEEEKKKELRLSKGLPRVRKNHQFVEINSSSKMNQSSKVIDVNRDFDNKIQRKSDTFNSEHDDNYKKNNYVYKSVYNKTNDNNNKFDVMKNQKLTITMRKKKGYK